MAAVAHAFGTGPVYINELLFNPPGADAPNAFIELRGPPNYLLPAGVFFVAVNGATNSNAGAIENVIDLSGRALGGNGYLVILQKDNLYSPSSNATVLVNTNSGPGYGSGATSSIRHRGSGGRTDLKHASVTFFLVQTALAPAPGNDIDADNNGVPDGPDYASWSVMDSVGAIDGAGEIGYGAVNFRRNASGVAGGVAVTVGFAPSYVARLDNSTDATAASWLAGDSLGGSAPSFVLGGLSKTYPSMYYIRSLDHLGAPNFGAAAADGVVLLQPGWSTEVVEGRGTDSYAVGLNTTPAGRVTVQVSAPAQLLVSTDAGFSWGATRLVALSNTTPRNVLVRALEDGVLDVSPHPAAIRHSITNTADSVRYPVGALPALLPVGIWETGVLRLNEIKVNPPGATDGPCEFVEFKGPPGARLTNHCLLALDGSATGNPGLVLAAFNLSGALLGSNGLLVLSASNFPSPMDAATGRLYDARFGLPGGALPNGAASFLLVSALAPVAAGTDLDKGDNATLEGLGSDAVVLDAVGWGGGGAGDVVYGGADLTLAAGAPDAASRYPGRDGPCDATAWFFGTVQGPDPASLVFQSDNVSPGFPFNTMLTPGVPNNTAPLITPVDDLCGAIGDPTNPQITFAVDDAEDGPDAVQVFAVSSDPAVVPQAGLAVTAYPGGIRTLSIAPVGVGYALITLTATDGRTYSQVSFHYAASADLRGGGRFHSGASDASAAAALDAGYMLVGDDEKEIIRLYARDQSGPPVNQFDMVPFLELTDQSGGTPREVDIESCIRIGQRVFWLGSLSTSWVGNVRVNRSRMFATDISGSGEQTLVSYAGRYDGLKEDILAWDAGNLHGKGAHYYGLTASAAQGVDPKLPDGSGLTIEGACMAPGSDTTAYLAFRAPLVPPSARSRALIVVVTNFPSMALAGVNPGAARFGPPIELNLGGRGVRDIALRGSNILIVAGAAGRAGPYTPSEFKLFTWDGQPGHQPQQRAAALDGLNPEAVVELPPAPWSATNRIQLVSDNGTAVFYGDGVEAKQLDTPQFKKARSDWVSLGSAALPEPFIRPLWRQGTNAVISWYALERAVYRVQYKDRLSDTAWTDLSGDVTAADSIASKPVSLPAAGPRFFRVKAVSFPP